MRFLALDVGDKRTGVALGDDESSVATPAGVVETPLNDRLRWLDAIASIVQEHGPDAIVVGLPLNMDGSAGPPARIRRDLASELKRRFELPVHLHDERLSTEEARRAMAGSGLTHGQKKRRKDALAAAVILQAFLDERCA